MIEPAAVAAKAQAVSSYTVRDLFERAYRIYGDRVAVTSEDAELTYQELGERASRLASVLHELGIGKGDRVAVLSETRPEYVETYAAAASLGAIVLALNIRVHPDELAYCVQSGRPTVLITSGTRASVAAHLRASGCPVTRWLCYDGGHEGMLDYAELLASAGSLPPPVDLHADDVHNVLYTSGTTGRPKGAMISHGAAAVRGLRLAQWFGLTENDGFIGWLPLFHCGGDESLYATVLTGGTYGTLRQADPETMFRMIERDRLSWTLLLPGVITDFLDHPRRREFDLSSLRFAIGYANMMPSVVQRLTETLGLDFYDAFGQTEVSYLLAHGLIRPHQTPRLRKIPGPLLNVRIVDAELTDTPVGEPGECLVRGPSVMSGYLDDPAATEEVFRGGWLHTGDVLVRHEDGSLTFVDRRKYLIKTGGENVYPAEVEEVIARHEAVNEVCVVGVPDERWGESVKAVVVPAAGMRLSRRDLADWCHDRLAGYKRPRYIQFVTAEQLPRSATGKVQRHELAKLGVADVELV